MYENNSQTDIRPHDIISMLMKTSRLHRQAVENTIAGEVGIHRSQHIMLMALAHAEYPPSQKELADKFCISPAAVAVTLKKLENEGYIERSVTAGDSRRNDIMITAKGLDTVKRSEELFAEIDRRSVTRLGNAEIQSMMSSLNIIYDNLQELANTCTTAKPAQAQIKQVVQTKERKNRN